MKYIISLFFIYSTSAFACPNLSGTFECEGDDDPETMTISQKIVNGVTVYTVDEDTLIADGVAHPVKDDNLKDLTYTLTCNGAYANLNFSGSIPDGETGETIGTFVSDTVASLDSDKNLSQDTKVKINLDGEIYEEAGVTICTRK